MVASCARCVVVRARCDERGAPADLSWGESISEAGAGVSDYSRQ